MKKILILTIIFIFLSLNKIYALNVDIRVLLFQNPIYLEFGDKITLKYNSFEIFNESKIYYIEKDLNTFRVRVGIFISINDALKYYDYLKEKIQGKEFFINFENGKYALEIGDFKSNEERETFKLINKLYLIFMENVDISGFYIFFGSERLKIQLKKNELNGIIFEIYPQNDFVKVNNRKYRGYIYLYVNFSTSYIINKLNIEDYLKGVVPSEMPASFNIEALKAQAVAARTYALSRIKEKNIYDVTATPLTQAYLGVDKENEKTTLAVETTKNEVITFDGKIIEALYHSTSGGYTENNENVWFSTPYPYLRGVESPYEDKSPHYSWTQTFTNYRIQMLFKKYFKQNNLYDIGEIIGFEVIKRGVSPRVVEIKVIGMYEDLILTGPQFQSILGLKSTWFDFEFKVYRFNHLYSIVNMVDKLPLFKSSFDGLVKKFEDFEYNIQDIRRRWDIVVFKGKGWGHGVGMSQWGAQGFAENGLNYINILKHYYTGTNVVKLENGN
ncbi:MAG: SpoIID/LytB domain-containing protein [Caldisericia bacterium]|nr:SpoIID/LytB domain-containing protein [Caldisericia bacterium]